MSLADKITLVVSVLLLLDGALGLVLLRWIEPFIRSVFPRLNVVALAVAEVLLGALLAVYLIVKLRGYA